jgi:hypothetical protein
MTEPPFLLVSLHSLLEKKCGAGDHRKVSSVFTLEGEDLVWTSTDK